VCPGPWLMDCSNAIGVVRVGGEVVVEARRTGRGIFIYFLDGDVLWSGWQSNRRRLRAIWPHFLKTSTDS
jgi:hypothetical protein